MSTVALRRLPKLLTWSVMLEVQAVRLALKSALWIFRIVELGRSSARLVVQEPVKPVRHWRFHSFWGKDHGAGAFLLGLISL